MEYTCVGGVEIIGKPKWLSEIMPPCHFNSFKFTSKMCAFYTAVIYCTNVSDHCVLVINIHNGASL